MKSKNAGLKIKSNIKAGVVSDNGNDNGKGIGQTGGCPPGQKDCVSIA